MELKATTTYKGKPATVYAELSSGWATGSAFWAVDIVQGEEAIYSGHIITDTAADAMACALEKIGAEGLSAEPLPLYEGETVKVYDDYPAEEIAIYCGGRFALSYCYGINGEPNAEELKQMARRVLETVKGKARKRARKELAEALACF